ncbi:MAG: class I SAM-dependent methyltransferase [Bacteroidota bacterium]
MRVVLFICISFFACNQASQVSQRSTEGESLETKAEPQNEAIYMQGKQSYDGIGKYYMGREISQVMGHLGAGWLERPEREAEEKGSLLMDALELKPTDVVADIGAGSGYFTFKIAPLVPQGGVKAVDIQQEMLDIMAKKQKENGLDNVEYILGTEDDPKLPPQSVDLVLMVDVYHEFAYPREMMERIVTALSPNARVVLVEYRGEDPSVPIKPLHKMTAAQVEKEMQAVGLRLIENKSMLPRQHCLIFAQE